MTPSTMPARIASIRPRSRASSASRAAELLDRLVERPRDGAELVVAEVEPARREVAGAIAPRDVGDAAHAVPEPAA